MIIKQKIIYFLQVLFQKLSKEKAGKTLHYFLNVSQWIVQTYALLGDLQELLIF